MLVTCTGVLAAPFWWAKANKQQAPKLKDGRRKRTRVRSRVVCPQQQREKSNVVNTDELNHGSHSHNCITHKGEDAPKFRDGDWESGMRRRRRNGDRKDEGDRFVGWMERREKRKMQGGPFTHVVPWLYNPLKRKEKKWGRRTERESQTERMKRAMFGNAHLHSFFCPLTFYPQGPCLNDKWEKNTEKWDERRRREGTREWALH